MSPVVCVAAYMGNHEEWALFGNDWSPILELSGIDCFHAKDQRCDHLREPLAECINRREVTGLIVATSAKKYTRNMEQDSRSTLGNAYAACTFACAGKLGDIAKDSNLGPIAY